MKRYQRRPEIVKATQWVQHGDHPGVVHRSVLQERFGWIRNGNGSSGGHVVSPGDWIIEREGGRIEVITNGEFLTKYEEVPDARRDEPQGPNVPVVPRA